MEIGLKTLNDVLLFNGLAPKGINLAQLKQVIQQRMSGGVMHPPAPHTVIVSPHTEQHSWFGLCGHVLTRQSTLRVHIGPLMVTPYGCVLATSWRLKNATWKTRAVTPLMLAAAHLLWTRMAVVSDASDSEDTTEVPPEYLLADTELPMFTSAAPENLNDTQTHMFQLALREVNRFQKHSLLALIES